MKTFADYYAFYQWCDEVCHYEHLNEDIREIWTKRLLQTRAVLYSAINRFDEDFGLNEKTIVDLQEEVEINV